MYRSSAEGVAFDYGLRRAGRIDIGRTCGEETPLQPMLCISIRCRRIRCIALTRRSTPALPSASFSFDTSVVSTVLACGAGFGGAVGMEAVSDCCVVCGGTYG